MQYISLIMFDHVSSWETNIKITITFLFIAQSYPMLTIKKQMISIQATRYDMAIWKKEVGSR